MSRRRSCSNICSCTFIALNVSLFESVSTKLTPSNDYREISICFAPSLELCDTCRVPLWACLKNKNKNLKQIFTLNWSDTSFECIKHEKLKWVIIRVFFLEHLHIDQNKTYGLRNCLVKLVKQSPKVVKMHKHVEIWPKN